jgi:DNA helicase-2/ATP-dependent DNA helicase PcrA
VQRIVELVENEGCPLKAIAILYRSHFHAGELPMTLTRCGAPFEISSGVRFIEKAHIKEVLDY